MYSDDSEFELFWTTMDVILAHFTLGELKLVLEYAKDQKLYIFQRKPKKAIRIYNSLSRVCYIYLFNGDPTKDENGQLKSDRFFVRHPSYGTTPNSIVQKILSDKIFILELTENLKLPRLNKNL